MKIIDTSTLTTLDCLDKFSESELLWIYNGLDCGITFEIRDKLKAQLDPITERVYNFERALMAPIFEMEYRGVLIDDFHRRKVIEELGQLKDRLAAQLDRILREGVGIDWDFNPASPAQCSKLLYDVMKLPPQKTKGRVTTDEKALEKLRAYFYAEPIVKYILEIRGINKKLGVLKTNIDSDGRMRTSFNIGGTDTGRLSSSSNSFGSGTNLQNITEELRRMFVADPGYKLAYIDLEQAESRAVGGIIWNVFQDGRYLDACESGDLHTTVCRMCWESLPWTGNLAQDKKIAKQPFHRHFNYRDAAKRLGHATNYFGKPPHIAREIHIEVELVKDFQSRYLPAFGLTPWHEYVRERLQRDGFITSLMGRRRHFFGRRWEDETLRSAIAYDPQSSVADILNSGLIQLHNANLPVHLLLQIHDAVLIQYKEEIEDEILPKVQAALTIKVPLAHDRELVIPTEAMTGWNWSYCSDKNPDGLVVYNGADKRERLYKPGTSLMDCRV